MKIQRAPKVLILQLKRFKVKRTTGFMSFFKTIDKEKVKKFIDFEIDELDLSDYIL